MPIRDVLEILGHEIKSKDNNTINISSDTSHVARKFIYVDSNILSGFFNNKVSVKINDIKINLDNNFITIEDDFDNLINYTSIEPVLNELGYEFKIDYIK